MEKVLAKNSVEQLHRKKIYVEKALSCVHWKVMVHLDIMHIIRKMELYRLVMV